MQNFQRDDTVVLYILCEVNRCHSATAKLAIDTIGIGQRRAHALDWGRHAISRSTLHKRRRKKESFELRSWPGEQAGSSDAQTARCLSPKVARVASFQAFTSQPQGKCPVIESSRMPVNSAFQKKVTYITFVSTHLRHSRRPLISRPEAAIQTFVYGFAKNLSPSKRQPSLRGEGRKARASHVEVPGIPKRSNTG